MHVLVLTALYPPAVGGAATHYGHLAPGLARQKEIEQVIVLTERMPGQPRQSDLDGVTVLRYLPTRSSAAQRVWPIHSATYLLTQLWFAVMLRSVMRRYRVDLVHFHTRYRGPLFHAAVRQSPVPVVADLHDKMADPASLAGVVDRLLCCGEGVRRFAIDGGFPADRVALIPLLFIVPERPSPERVAEVRCRYGLGDEPYLLFVGDVTQNKGVYHLLEAYQRWRAGHIWAWLVFAGVNREGNRFLRHVGRVCGATYLGYVPHRDVLALVRGAEMLVLPSRSEGLPHVILEAAAMGTKVLCPPGIPEFDRFVPEFVLPEVSVDAIVQMLSAVWTYEHVPTYPLAQHDPQRVVEAVLGVYREMLEEPLTARRGVRK